MIEALQDMKVKSVETFYDFKSVGGGYFLIEFGGSTSTDTNSYKLSFAAFLEWLFENNPKMFEYAKKHFKDTDKTLSDIVEDLYTLGVDLEDYIQQYFSFVKDSIDPATMLKLLQFMQFLRKFGENEDFDSDNE